MSRKSSVDRLSRRSFLKELAVTGGAAAVAVSASRLAAAPVEQTTAPKNQKSSGYHETPHIRKYYDKASI